MLMGQEMILDFKPMNKAGDMKGGEDICTAGSPEIVPEMIEDLKDAFNLVDIDRGGDIDVTELKIAARSFPPSSCRTSLCNTRPAGRDARRAMSARPVRGPGAPAPAPLPARGSPGKVRGPPTPPPGSLAPAPTPLGGTRGDAAAASLTQPEPVAGSGAGGEEKVQQARRGKGRAPGPAQTEGVATHQHHPTPGPRASRARRSWLLAHHPTGWDSSRPPPSGSCSLGPVPRVPTVQSRDLGPAGSRPLAAAAAGRS